jgi:hypothetical protein
VPDRVQLCLPGLAPAVPPCPEIERPALAPELLRELLALLPAGEVWSLTLWRPWQHLILVAEDPEHPECPPKLVENRPWYPLWACQPMRNGIALGRTDRPLWIAIHAGLKLDEDAWWDAKELMVGNPGYKGRRLVNGNVITPGHPSLIVGIGRLARVLHVDRLGMRHPEVLRHGPWISGPYAWELADRVAFAEPVSCKGLQKLWQLPPAVLEAVRVEWARGLLRAREAA